MASMNKATFISKNSKSLLKMLLRSITCLSHTTVNPMFQWHNNEYKKGTGSDKVTPGEKFQRKKMKKNKIGKQPSMYNKWTAANVRICVLVVIKIQSIHVLQPRDCWVCFTPCFFAFWSQYPHEGLGWWSDLKNTIDT